MSSVLPTDQWSVREKLCLASSVIRSGDQNWVSVSRAIKPFSEPGRPPDWFSQKNCACQYSALLEAVDTPKRKRSERGEVVDTPGDLIVRKMTRERVAELNVRLEEDRVRYRQLQWEIEQIRSGQLDDRLPVMLDDIQDQKRAAEEAEEARRLAALAKATVAVKPSSKIPFQSPNKRRPQAKHPRPVSVATHLSTAEMSSVQAERVDLEDASPTAGPDAARSSEEGGTIAEPPDLLISTEFDKELDATVEDVIAEDSDETVERLLAATANDLVELLSPYPVDSLTLPGPVAANPTPTPAPRQEPLILKIEKGVLKTKEPKVETSTPKPKTDVEVTGGKELDSEALVTSTPQPVKILEDVAKSSGDPDDDKPHPPIKPPSPRDSSLQDDSDQKIKKKYPGRGRPPGSQRKHHRGRPPAVTQEDNDDQRRATSSPPGRRTAGKDVLVTTGLSSLTDDGKEDTHSEAEDSDITDKHGESDRDDLSAGAMQSSSFFMDSLPNSPASVSHSEEDHAYKILRKAIMLVWRAIASHKYANVFLHPVTEDIAPGYNSIVLRPMNLMTIKKNVENGVTRTTDQFHRDMMLMFQNAIMYNNADQHVHQIANTMQADVIKQIEEFVSTQLLVQQPESTKMLRGRGKHGQGEEERTRRSSTETDTSGKKRRTRSDE